MNEQLIEITFCEVCGNDCLTPVLNLGLHPMCDDLVSVTDDRQCREYPIEILFCSTCFTAHQRFQVPKHDLFPSTYHYRSRFTADVLNGMEALVEACEQNFGKLTEKKILDIGCNDGSLLDFFHQKGAITLGIEPTDACLDAEKKGHVTFNNFLSEEVAKTIVAAHGKPDFISFTNVFAHIENLGEVLNSLKHLIDSHTVIVIENHYLGSVLDNSQFDTFYHEHPRTYSYNSFIHMANSLGLSLLDVEFPARYGGNIRVYLGAKPSINDGSTDLDALNKRENNFIEKFLALQEKVNTWRTMQKKIIKTLVQQHGKLRAKAFPGRAAILVKLLGLNEELISAVYEKPGSLKIGHYLPGTHIPIKSDEELFAKSDKTKPILNLAWHIPNEIQNYLIEHEYKGQMINILGPVV